jgi:putative copper export protein
VGWNLIRATHLVAMAFFVGGQLMLAATVVPVERKSPDPERLRAIARRFGWGTLVAIATLIATGSAMASHYHQWSSGTLHVKLALVAVVAALVVWHMLRPRFHAIEAAIFLVSLAIVWLGVKLAHPY